MEFTYKGARDAVPGLSFGAGRLVEWQMRRACSPFEAWGAWQLSRFAEHAQRCLNVKQLTRQKISRGENVLRLVTVYDREASPYTVRKNILFLTF